MRTSTKCKIITILFLFFCISASPQVNKTKWLSEHEYLEKSKHQNTGGWILTAGGGAMIVSGLVLLGSQNSYFPNEEVGAALLIGGAAAVTGGIILFNASKKNKERAVRSGALIQLKLENAKIVTNGKLTTNYYPSFSLSLDLP